MVGLFWNCRGVCKKGLNTCLKELIGDYKVDFVCIQETMRKKFDDKFFRSLDGQENFQWAWIPSRGKSRGMLSGIRKERLVLTFMTSYWINVYP